MAEAAKAEILAKKAELETLHQGEIKLLVEKGPLTNDDDFINEMVDYFEESKAKCFKFMGERDMVRNKDKHLHQTVAAMRTGTEEGTKPAIVFPKEQ